jgi:predicted RNA-binding protein with PUA-like domain
MNGGGLQSRLDHTRPHRRTGFAVDFPGNQRFDGAEQRHSNERDDLRAIPPDLAVERLPAFHVLGWFEIVYPGTGPGNEVGDAISELGQTPVLLEGDVVGQQAGFPQQLPEAVRESREVVPGERRPDAGIDADEEHTQAGLYPVRQAAGSEGGAVCHTISRMNWLFKEEPTHYSFDDLVRDGKTSWTGVRNPVAQKHLRAVAKGDRIFFYHTGNEKAVIGIAKAAAPAYPDPSDASGKLYAVDILPVKKLPQPVTLAAVKADKSFASFALTRVPRLSVMPVTDDEWDRIVGMSRV